MLLLGDASRAEMRPLCRWIETLTSDSCRLVICPDVESLFKPDSSPSISILAINEPSSPAASSLNAGEFPDLIIVLQSWPDEYSSQAVSRLLSFSPLSRVVVCCGAWCESLGRNRDVWPVSFRVPIWAAPARIQREWNSMHSHSPNPPPWTASREEIFAFDHSGQNHWIAAGTIQIDSPDPSYQQCLIELLIASGVRVSEANPTVLLWDADPWTASRQAALKRYRDEAPQVVVVALVDQIQTGIESDLVSLGVSSLVQKLGFHQQLAACCNSATDAHTTQNH